MHFILDSDLFLGGLHFRTHAKRDFSFGWTMEAGTQLGPKLRPFSAVSPQILSSKVSF